MDPAAPYVFYSWQSDLPKKFNRNFIEEAIEQALQQVNATVHVEKSPRAELVLEKDTKGVPGSPAVTDTIIKKIRGCVVFIGDLSFVGQSLPELVAADAAPRYFPNPNVIMEYAHALDYVGEERIVGIVNTAFGGDWAENVPFNIRHRRWPILYRYGPDSGAESKSKILKALVADLVGAIGLVHKIPVSQPTRPPFIGTNFDPNHFGRMAESGELIIDGPLGDVSCSIPQNCVLTLRLQPSFQVPEFETETDALAAVHAGHLNPMAAQLTGISQARNASGAISYSAPQEGQLVFLSQLFRGKEIYGIDAASGGALSWRAADGQPRHFHIERAELSFALTLKNYIGFARDTLKLPPPWRVSIAVYSIHNMVVAGKRCLLHRFDWDTTTGDRSALEILRPGFEKLWKAFGARRPDNADESLVAILQ